MTNAANTTQNAKCHRCGRTLTDPRRIATGYGRTCARKITEATRVAVATQPADRIAKATEAIETGAVVRRIHNLFQVVSSDGHTVYDVDLAAGSCTCRAGQFGRACFHRTAAALLAA